MKASKKIVVEVFIEAPIEKIRLANQTLTSLRNLDSPFYKISHMNPGDGFAFGSNHFLSLIKSGHSSSAYHPDKNGIFLRSFVDYKVRYGFLGHIFDRLFFRFFNCIACEHSFEILRNMAETEIQNPAEIRKFWSLAVYYLRRLFLAPAPDGAFGRLEVDPAKKWFDDKSRIVFFDGVCNLCDGLVRFLLLVDRERLLKYSSLQSEFAKSQLASEYTNENSDYQTFIFKNGPSLSFRALGIMNLMSEIGWPWRAVSIFRLLPTSLLDILYRFIATHRYRWFGKKDACRLLRKGESYFFIESK